MKKLNLTNANLLNFSWSINYKGNDIYYVIFISYNNLMLHLPKILVITKIQKFAAIVVIILYLYLKLKIVYKYL